MISRRLTLLTFGLACIGLAALGETGDRTKSTSEIRTLSIRSVELEANTVRIVSIDGASLTLAASDLKIVDERMGARNSQRKLAGATSATSAKVEQAHDLPVTVLSDLASQTPVPAVAKIKYEKDGTIKKIKLRIYDSSGLAAQAKQEMEQKELRREMRRPKNR